MKIHTSIALEPGAQTKLKEGLADCCPVTSEFIGFLCLWNFNEGSESESSETSRLNVSNCSAIDSLADDTRLDAD
jgi:hypothetical protein